MTIKKLVAVAALSMALLSGAAMADGHGEKSKRDKVQHKGERSEMMMERMTSRLGLSEQQAIDVKSLMAKHRGESKEAREAQRAQFEAEMAMILTPEQKAMLDENKEMRKEKMKDRKSQYKEKMRGSKGKDEQKEKHEH